MSKTDETHSYKVCLADVDVAPVTCIDFKGSEFATTFASFDVEDLTIRYPQIVSVEDLSTHKVAYKKFDNFPQNPEVITISLKDAGPARETQTTEETTTWTDPKTGLVYDIPTQGDYCLDFDGDSVCDIDFTDGNQVVYGETEVQEGVGTQIEEEDEAVGGDDGGRNNGDDTPRCEYNENGIETEGVCIADDGETVIGPSEVLSDDTGGSNPEGEEADQNCGGDSCTDDEKEDSSTDEDETDGEDE